jgi:hypothetical protein
MPEWIDNLIKVLGGAFVALGGKTLYDFIVTRHKTKAEARHISTTSDLSIHEMTLADAKEYRELFKKAEISLRQSRRHWMRAEFLIREMLYKMKASGVDGWQEDEERFNKMQAEFEAE